MTRLTFSQFSKANRERCESPDGFNHDLNSWSTSDWITAVMGELGEAANVVKKLNRVRDGIPGNPQVRICPSCGTSWRHDHIRVQTCSCHCDLGNVQPVPDPAFTTELRTNLRKELGDVFCYLDLLAQSLGFTIEEAAVEVFNAKSQQIGYDGPGLPFIANHHPL